MATFDADQLNDIDPAAAEPTPPVSELSKARLARQSSYEQLPDPDLDDDIIDPAEASARLDRNPETKAEIDRAIEAKIAEAAVLHDVEPVKPETDAVPGTTIALTDRLDVSTLGENWQHDWLEFKGDKLGIRLPTRQALAAFSLASSKYVDMQVKNDLTGLFIARHLSPESYGRVFSRLMDPDENDYTVDTVGELFNAIVTAAIKTDEKPPAK